MAPEQPGSAWCLVLSLFSLTSSFPIFKTSGIARLSRISAGKERISSSGLFLGDFRSGISLPENPENLGEEIEEIRQSLPVRPPPH